MSSTIDKEILGDLIVEMAMEEPFNKFEKFPVSEVDAFIRAVQGRMPEVSQEVIEEVAIEGGFFPPAEEICQYRQIQTQGHERSEPPTEKKGDYARRYQAVKTFVTNFFSGKVNVPENELDRIFIERAKKIDPDLTRKEFLTLVAEVTAPRQMKPLSDGVEAPRFYFGLSRTYEASVDKKVMVRQKIVCKQLLPTYQLPSSSESRNEILREIRTRLSFENLPFDDQTIQNDISCLRVGFLYYRGSESMRVVIERMLAEKHPSTIPLRYLIDEGRVSADFLGLPFKQYSKEEEEPVLEWLSRLSKDVKDAPASKTKPDKEPTIQGEGESEMTISQAVNREIDKGWSGSQADLARKIVSWSENRGLNFSFSSVQTAVSKEFRKRRNGQNGDHHANGSSDGNFEGTIKDFVSQHIPEDFHGEGRQELVKQIVADGKAYGLNLKPTSIGLIISKILKSRKNLPDQPKLSRQTKTKINRKAVVEEEPQTELPATKHIPGEGELNLSEYEIPKGTAGRTLRTIASKIEDRRARVEEFKKELRELETDFATLYKAMELANKYSE